MSDLRVISHGVRDVPISECIAMYNKKEFKSYTEDRKAEPLERDTPNTFTYNHIGYSDAEGHCYNRYSHSNQ